MGSPYYNPLFMPKEALKPMYNSGNLTQIVEVYKSMESLDRQERFVTALAIAGGTIFGAALDSVLAGVVLEESTFPLTPDDRFGRALLGRSAEVTAEILEESPEIFIPGDIAGRSGLQRQYNERLAGVPGFQIRVDRRFPTTTPSAAPSTTVAPDDASTTSVDQNGGETAEPADPGDPDVVFLSPPVEGTPLNLTIDPRFQTAAENALAQTELPSALVAIQVSTGHILAAANGPGAAVNNFAITGQYPPGSIFKTIVAAAGLQEGVIGAQTRLGDGFDHMLFMNQKI